MIFKGQRTIFKERTFQQCTATYGLVFVRQSNGDFMPTLRARPLAVTGLIYHACSIGNILMSPIQRIGYGNYGMHCVAYCAIFCVYAALL